MNFVFRRHGCRKHGNTLVEQFAGLIGRGGTTDSTGRRLVIVNAARLFRKALADVFGPPRHVDQGLIQSAHAGCASPACQFFRQCHIADATLDVRRRWQLRHRRGLALRTVHQMTLALIAKCLARSKPAFETVSVVAEKIENYHAFGWLVPGTGIEPVWLAPRDFKSLVSTNFTIRAGERPRSGGILEARPGIEPRYTALQAAVFCSKSITYYAHPPAIRPLQISNMPVCRKSCITADMIADTGVATLPLLTCCNIWHRREHRFSAHHCRC